MLLFSSSLPGCQTLMNQRCQHISGIMRKIKIARLQCTIIQYKQRKTCAHLKEFKRKWDVPSYKFLICLTRLLTGRHVKLPLNILSSTFRNDSASSGLIKATTKQFKYSGTEGDIQSSKERHKLTYRCLCKPMSMFHMPFVPKHQPLVLHARLCESQSGY